MLNLPKIQLTMPHAPKWILGRRSTAERARERRGIVLKDSLVKPKTLQQYYKYARKLLPIIRTARDESELDELLADHLEHLWEKGRPLYHASAGLCGLQFFMPWSKGKLVQTWKIFRIWRRLEVPCRAPPLPRDLLHAFAGKAIARGDLIFGALLLAGFDGLLRTGELLGLTGADLLIRKDIGLVRLADTKTSSSKGIAEVVTLKHEWTLMVLDTLVDYLREQRLLHIPIWRGTSAAFRQRFRSYCRAFRVHHMGFRPYRLRRGGATALFQDTLSYDAALEQGRWSSIRAAKLYIQDGLARLPTLMLSDEAQRLVTFWNPL